MMNASATIQTITKKNTSLNIPNSIVTMVAKIIIFRGVLFGDDLSFIGMLFLFLL